MKRIILSTLLLFLSIFFSYSKQAYSERVYIIKIIAFNCKYELYCTLSSIGYYKYEENINGKTVYLTYEGKEFFSQCKFDENLTILEGIYPCNMWANNKGEMLLMKKRYAPVIEKNRKRKDYPYGFGKN